MSSPLTDLKASSPQGTQARRPEDLPHGLVPPPPQVLEVVAREKAKFPPEIFTPQAEEWMTNDLTLQFYFDQYACDVAYRCTPQGPEVLAVGEEQIASLRQGMTEDEWRTLETWQF